MRDIDQENEGEFPALEAATDALRAALYAGGSLPPVETEKIGPLIAKAKALTGFEYDWDDGQNLAAWLEELESLAPTTERHLAAAPDGIHTRHIDSDCNMADTTVLAAEQEHVIQMIAWVPS
jgi:hypothetical protein